MFKNDVQRGRVCGVLTQWIGGAPYWRDDGAGVLRPTDEAFAVAEGVKGRSRSEVAMLRVAIDIWNGQGGAAFGDALYSFDGRNLSMLGRLLDALGSRSAAAVDRWLAEHEHVGATG